MSKFGTKYALLWAGIKKNIVIFEISVLQFALVQSLVQK